jgi:hypothetical protein
VSVELELLQHVSAGTYEDGTAVVWDEPEHGGAGLSFKREQLDAREPVEEPRRIGGIAEAERCRRRQTSEAASLPRGVLTSLYRGAAPPQCQDPSRFLVSEVMGT